MNPEQLDNALRKQAVATRPEFSNALHARLMSDVTRERVRPTALRRLFRPVALTALAAAAAVALFLSLRSATPPSPQQVATLEPLTELLDRAIQPLPEKLHEARFALLDRDAQRLARFLMDQLPTLPQGEPRVATSADHKS